MSNKNQQQTVENILESGKHLQVYASLGTVPEVVAASQQDFSQYCKDNFHINVDQMKRVSLPSPSFDNDNESSSASSDTINVEKSIIASGLTSSLTLFQNGSQSISARNSIAKANALKQVQDILFFSAKSRKIEEEVNKSLSSSSAETNRVAADGTTSRSNTSTVVTSSSSLDSLRGISDLCHLCQEQAKEIDMLKEALMSKNSSLEEEGPRSALVAERGRNLLLSAELEDVKQKLRESEETVQDFASVISQLKADVRQLVEMHSVGDFHGSV